MGAIGTVDSIGCYLQIFTVMRLGAINPIDRTIGVWIPGYRCRMAAVDIRQPKIVIGIIQNGVSIRSTESKGVDGYSTETSS